MKEKTTKDQLITDTDFVKKLTSVLGEIIGRESELNGEGKLVDRPDYVKTEQDEYAHSVFQAAINIQNTFEQLEFIPIFVSRFPDRKYFGKHGINHPKYLQYHLETHFIKIATLFDQSLRLVSEIYRLGIPPKLITQHQLSENKFTKKSKSLDILKNFNKSIQGIKAMRNLITHRGEYYDDQIDRVAQLYFLSSATKDDEEPLFPEFTLNYFMKDVVRNRKEFLIANNRALKVIILILFNESYIQFTTKFLELKTRDVAGTKDKTSK